MEQTTSVGQEKTPKTPKAKSRFDFGGEFRAVRKALRLSQAGLAREIGVDQTAISQYERNKTAPSVEVLMRLHTAAATNREIQALVGRLIGVRVSTLRGEELDLFLARLQSDEAGWDTLFVAHSAIQELLGTLTAQKPGSVRFLSEARQLLELGTSIDPVLSDLVRLYREHQKDPRMSALLKKVLAFLEIGIQPTANSTTGKGDER